MGEPAVSDELVEQWADRKWRLNNLYTITDRYGTEVPFELNEQQERLLDELHYLNIVLKARQMGFSTFILVLALDCCIFNSNFEAGLIADTLPNARNLLDRVRFTYHKMPEEIRKVVVLSKDSADELAFSNGSSIEVGVSLRSGTKNFIHISEYGKICAQHPEKAKEIKSGSLNTLAQGQLGFIESTAEGRGGDYYDKVSQASRIEEEGRQPLDMEWKLHFFPWYDEPTYKTSQLFPLNADDEKYFADLVSEHGIELTDQQKWWYAAKYREQGEDMWKEYPSTVEEAFLSAKQGAYFAKQIRNLRQLGRIREIPFDPRFPVNTFWDLGVSDSTTIWFHQLIAGLHRFCGYYENSGEGIEHYLDYCDKWRAKRCAVFGIHHGPHDIEHRKQVVMKARGELLTIKSVAAELGFQFEVVTRSPDKLNSIQSARTNLMTCEFDSKECEAGLVHLENYSREWDEKYGVWKPHPRHDEHSHGADGFMTFSDGYAPEEAPDEDDEPRGRPRGASGGWMGA